MFDSYLFESRPDNNRIGSRKKPATLAMSTVVHVLIAAALILIPLLQTQAVPPIALPPPAVRLSAPGATVRFVKLAGTPSSGRTAPPPASTILSEAVIAPTAVPDKITYIVDAIDVGSMDALYAGSSTGPDGMFGPSGGIGLPGPAGPPVVAAPPPPPPAPPTAPPPPRIPIREPIRVSSSLQVSRLVRQVDPAYPSLPRIARVEGTVVAEARISQSGTVDSLRIISGNPLFYQSVLDAVKQWRYQPTLLNGEPIEVITTITVNFTLK